MTSGAMVEPTTGHDVTFQIGDERPRGFKIFRGRTGHPGLRGGRNLPVQPGSPLPAQDLPMISGDFSGGGGYSQKWAPNVYLKTFPGDARDPRGVCQPSELEYLPMPVGALTGRWTCAFELDNVSASVPPDLYLMGDHYAFIVKTGTSGMNVSAYFSDLFTPLSAARYGGGPAYVFGEGGLNIWRAPVSVTDVWTQSTDFAGRHVVNVSMVFGAAFGGTGVPLNAFVADVDGSVIKWTTGDPMFDVNWKPLAGQAIGQGHHAITGLVAATKAFAVLKADGCYKVEGSGESKNLTPYWEKDTVIGHAGICGMFVGGHLFASHPRMYDMVPFTDTRQIQSFNATPGAWPIPNESDIDGQITANTMSGTGELIVALYNHNTDQSTIWLGRLRANGGPDGIGPVLWHGAYQVIPGRCTLLHVTSLAEVGAEPEPWLYMGSTVTTAQTLNGRDYTATMHMHRCRLARGGAPLRDPSYPFAPKGYIYLSNTDGGEQHSATLKSTRRVEAQMEGTPGVNRIRVATSADGAAVGESTRLDPPRQSAIVEQQEGTGFAPVITLEGSRTSPTVLRSFTLHTTLRPEQASELHMLIDCGPSLATRAGAIEIELMKENYRYLQRLAQEEDVLLTVDGDTILGKVMGDISFTTEAASGESGYRRVVPLRFVETTTQDRYGHGRRYGGGVQYA